MLVVDGEVALLPVLFPADAPGLGVLFCVAADPPGGVVAPNPTAKFAALLLLVVGLVLSTEEELFF